MFYILGALIDVSLLAFLLALVEKIKAWEDLHDTIIVLALTIIVGFLSNWILGGYFWGIPALAIKVAALYFFIGYFFYTTKKGRLIIAGAFFGVKILLGMLFSS